MRLTHLIACDLIRCICRSPDFAFDMRIFIMMPFAFFQNIGTTELLIVAFVSLLVFGNRLPSVMRSLGKSVTEFKKGISGIEDDIDQAVTAEKKPTEHQS